MDPLTISPLIFAGFIGLTVAFAAAVLVGDRISLRAQYARRLQAEQRR
jgi:hypothetical protein